MDVVVQQEESRATWKTDGRDAETDLGAVAVAVVLVVVFFVVAGVKAEAEPEKVLGMDIISRLAAAAALLVAS